MNISNLKNELNLTTVQAMKLRWLINDKKKSQIDTLQRKDAGEKLADIEQQEIGMQIIIFCFFFVFFFGLLLLPSSLLSSLSKRNI